MDTSRIIENVNATVTARCIPEQPNKTVTLPGKSQLCLACNRIFNIESDPHPAYGEHFEDQCDEEKRYQSIASVAEAAKTGCHLCTVILMNLDPASLRAFQRYALHHHGQANLTSLDTAIGAGYSTVFPVARDQARLSFRWCLGPASAKGHSSRSPTPQRLKAFDGNRSQLTLVSQSNSTPGRMQSELRMELIIMNPIYAGEPGVRIVSSKAVSTDSDECFELAKQWLVDCSFNHMECSANEGVSPTSKPRRLLDLTIRDAKGVPGLKVIDGELLDPFTEYITLSHCWGISRDPSLKRTRLHRKTMPALRQGVACSSLPQTFADAANITVKLGYKYLWIDALCIMHDSEQEVLEEVSKMHRIYGQATLNLVATAATDDFAGMYQKRNVLSLQPVTIEISNGLGIDPGTYKILRSTVWEDLVDLSPAAQRSWIFQERALSKRVLHFTRNELLWECQQMCCSEVYPKGLPVTLKGAAEKDRRVNGVGMFQTSWPTVRDCSLHPGPTATFNKRIHQQRAGDWSSLVELYTDGRQTYTSDKLLGISGLARQYLAKNHLRPEDYIVGLWRSSLPHSLLWRIGKGGRRPAKYRAPSWTWAAVDGRVVSPALSAASKQTCLEIIDITTVMKYGDPMGLCEGGRLKVRGFMARGRIPRDVEYWGHCTFILTPSNPAASSVKFEHAWFDERMTGLCDPGSENLLQTTEIYLLPVVDVMDRVEGLILGETAKQGELKRLGVFEINNGNAHPESNVSQEVKRLMQQNWDNFKVVMKGDKDMLNFEERLDHSNAYWFASDYTYTMTIL